MRCLSCCVPQTPKNVLRLGCLALAIGLLLWMQGCAVERLDDVLQIDVGSSPSGGGADHAADTTGGRCARAAALSIGAHHVRWGAGALFVLFCCCPCCSLDTAIGESTHNCILNRRKPRWIEERDARGGGGGGDVERGLPQQPIGGGGGNQPP